MFRVEIIGLLVGIVKSKLMQNVSTALFSICSISSQLLSDKLISAKGFPALKFVIDIKIDDKRINSRLKQKTNDRDEKHINSLKI